MRRPRVGARTPTLAALLAVALACGGDDGTGPPPAALSVSPGQQTILTGDTLQLTATLSGNALAGDDVEWSSSAPAVATVLDDGRVIAAGPGSATITGAYGEATGRAYVFVHRGGGRRVPALAAFDSIIPATMARWGIPGGAVAVVHDGRLVLARGYGLADQATGREVEPDDLFRIASVSKPITSVAILRLHEQGSLDLDLKAFSLLEDLEPPEGADVDERLADISVRQLLYHSGGWDRNATFDPMFRPGIAAAEVGAPAPASAETVIRYMKGQPLQFAPGAGYAYSNFGYNVLGRVIERVTGSAYVTHVREEILEPLGIERMQIGRSLPADRHPDEVSYYDGAHVQSVFPGIGPVPIADGGFHLEAMDAHGGWIASVVDLMRFMTAVDRRPGRPDILAPATLDLMTAPPGPPLWVGSAFHYAMGWLVRPAGGDANWWHDGSLPGTTALLVRTHDGRAWAALFNARAFSATSSFIGELDQALWAGVQSVSTWPAHDLFGDS